MSSKRALGKKFWCIYITGGVLLLSMVIFASLRADKGNCEQHLVSTIDYIKTQYSSYVKYNCTAVAKGLLREKNAVHALQDCSLDCDEEELKEHTQKLWLTGISILDAEGNLVSEYAEDGVGYAQFQSEIEKEMLLSVIDAPKKTYVKHIEMADGSFMDIAARRCAEGAGAVLAYRHTEAEFSQKSILSVQDLLDGYDSNLMGTLLMVSDDRVMASNTPEMIGMNVMGNELIMSIRRTNQAEKLIHVNVGGWLSGGYYGVYSHGRNGYIYAYIPAKQMYSVLISNLAAALVAYVLVLLLIQTLSWNSEKSFKQRQEKRELEYKESLEQKNAQLELAVRHEAAANRAKREFLFNMSHDIRTPMNAIIGFTSLAAAHIHNQDQVLEYLKKISAASQHLLSLINDVLDMSRIESGKVTLETKPVHLPDLVHDIRDIIQSSAAAKRLSLFIDTVDVVNEDIIADPMRLNQILLNILSNAIKFTQTGGTIALRIAQTGTSPNGFANYEFRVRDNGIGMSAEFKEHIFEQFSREKTSTVSKIQGTGLGMSITKSLVDMMGGTITVESEVGKGTEFLVSLRFPIGEKAKKVKQIPQLEGLRALVVDDDTHNCLNVSKMLRTIGMRPDWTTSGKEAVIRVQDAAEQGDLFSVCIIDWLIPDMNGIEVARQVRKIIDETTPIIILTAYDWTDIEEEAQEAGVTAFCAKPLFMSELKRVLEKPFYTEKLSEAEPRMDFSGKRLLVVEDNELNMEIATTILREAGFEVDTAENGRIAVEKVKASDGYDAVLMDIQMPEMDGYEATRRIRSLPDFKKAVTPVIAMTANAFEEDRRNAMDAGMNEHISKPIDVEKLMSLLKRVMK